MQQLCQQHGRVLADGGDRGCGELVTPRFAGNRTAKDDAYRGHRRRRARAEHTTARTEDWRALREHRRTGDRVVDSLRAVAVRHNTRLDVAA